MSNIVPALYEEMSNTFDPRENPYAWASEWQFAIAEVLYLNGEEIPAAWQYQPSLSIRERWHGIDDLAANSEAEYSYEQEIVASLFLSHEARQDDLIYAGNVLSRYIKMLDSLGLTY